MQILQMLKSNGNPLASRSLCLSLFTLGLTVLSLLAYSQNNDSTRIVMLDSIIIKGYRHTTPIKINSRGVTIWKMNNLAELPQIMSNSDPIHYAQMLPGIQTNSEYKSGLHVEGCDNLHNIVSLEGVPLYNVNHLLGFFSTFNASHFSAMKIEKTYACNANRIGSRLDMLLPKEVDDTISSVYSIGLMSSQGTFRIPVNSKASLSLSLRGSYMNLLYSGWMKADNQIIKYSFYDANATLVHHMGDNHTFLLNFYYGGDHAGFEEARYLANMKARWGNTLGAIHWIYNNERKYTHAKSVAYVTSYNNCFKLNMPKMTVSLPSDITDIGLKCDVQYKRWCLGMEAIGHIIHPQYLENNDTLRLTRQNRDCQHSIEATAYASFLQQLNSFIECSIGLRLSTISQESTSYITLDPSLSLHYNKDKIHLSASYAIRHQYVFQTGFSDIGLPSEFWISSNKYFKPQYAHILNFEGVLSLLDGRYLLTTDFFYRKLYHLLDYQGSVLDCLNSDFDIVKSLKNGKGENYGFSVMINKNSGKLSGWFSYTYTHTTRVYDSDDITYSYPANHERPHEINMMLNYKPYKHWSFGGTMVCASGTPYTAAQSLYLLNNNIIMQYGKRNGYRLKPYIRIDLSANYKWFGKKGSEHCINLSLYNVACRENELFYYIKTDSKGSFAYQPLSFVLRILPSVSYSCII